MKTRNLWWGLSKALGIAVLMFWLLLGGRIVYADVALPPPEFEPMTSDPPEGEGGGFWRVETDRGISSALWQEIIQRARANETALAAQGNLIATNPEAVILFDLPVQWNEAEPRPVYYGITQFYNHGSSVVPVDYKNKDRSYDDHRGTDYLPFPFPWNMMDDSAVQVVAAADGEIVELAGDRDDRNCSIEGPDNPNYILLKHANDTYSIYLHLKKNSLTAKGVGQYVARGEYLGLIGSSGRSTAPHLHFEWRQAAYSAAMDLYKGPGNPFLPTVTSIGTARCVLIRQISWSAALARPLR